MIRFLAILAITLLAGCGNPTASVPGEPPDLYYHLRTKTDCGPAALAFATQIPYHTILAVWQWPNFGDQRDNLWDTPVSHLRVLKNLGVKFRLVDGDEIAAGLTAPNRTVVLIHGFKNPYTNQHWAVFAGLGTGTVQLFMGDSEFAREYSIKDFLRLFYSGVPQCAYEVIQ